MYGSCLSDTRPTLSTRFLMLLAVLACIAIRPALAADTT